MKNEKKKTKKNNRNCIQRTRVSPPEKCKLLTPSADGDGRTDGQWYHYMPFPPFFEWRGLKNEFIPKSRHLFKLSSNSECNPSKAVISPSSSQKDTYNCSTARGTRVYASLNMPRFHSQTPLSMESWSCNNTHTRTYARSHACTQARTHTHTHTCHEYVFGTRRI